jgi:hypothetical protein
MLLPNRLLAGAALVFLAACAPVSRRSSPLVTEVPVHSTTPVTSRIVFVIHGDADYVWHDTSGTQHTADVEILGQALEIAHRDTTAEVFVFHQKSRGRFVHYRAGRLQSQKGYARTRLSFEAEARVLREQGGDSSLVPLILIYFGHEIPVVRQGGYNASHAGTPFSAADFKTGMTRLSDRRFDLVVVSACYGGNPVLMGEVAARARFAVASPATLHLSSLNLGALGDPKPAGFAIEVLADSIAAQSFRSLKARTQTEITVGVYDLEKSEAFLVSPVAAAQADQDSGVWMDCARDPAFRTSEGAAAAEAGTKLYYRPPRFGPRKNTATRSAWQCRL